jgi:hypothetical protein
LLSELAIRHQSKFLETCAFIVTDRESRGLPSIDLVSRGPLHGEAVGNLAIIVCLRECVPTPIDAMWVV